MKRRSLLWIVSAIVVVSFAALLLFALNLLPEPGDASASAKQELGSVKAVSAALAALPRDPRWQSVVVNQAEPGSFRLTLNYATEPSPDTTVEADTAAIAQALLRALVAAGRDPAAERISIWVWAQVSVTGETGKPMLLVYGSTDYDAVNNRLEYAPFHH